MGMTRLPDAEHLGRPWRVHEIAAGFVLEDVWGLPTPGGPGDFPKLVAGATAMDPERSGPLPVRALFAIRWAIGGVLGRGEDGNGGRGRGASLGDRGPRHP